MTMPIGIAQLPNPARIGFQTDTSAGANSIPSSSGSLGSDGISSGNPRSELETVLLELMTLLTELLDGSGNSASSTPSGQASTGGDGGGTLPAATAAGGGGPPASPYSSPVAGGAGDSAPSSTAPASASGGPAVPGDTGVVAVAARQIGVQASSTDRNEDPGGADGPIHAYQSSTGAYDQAWCASFVTWALEQAHAPTDFKSANVDSWVQAARAGQDNLHAIDSSQMKPGDLVAFDWSGANFTDQQTHIGIISKVNGNGSFDYISGNSGNGAVSQTSERLTSPTTGSANERIQVIRVGS